MRFRRQVIEKIAAISLFVLGTAIFAAAFVGYNPWATGDGTDTIAQAQAQADYSAQWIMSEKRRVVIMMPNANLPGGEPPCNTKLGRKVEDYGETLPADALNPDNVCDFIDTGASQWEVRICLDGTMEEGGTTELGTCRARGDGKPAIEINETWKAKIWKHQGDKCCEMNFRVFSYDQPGNGTKMRGYSVQSQGDCQRQGRAFRSGMYGIIWTTTDGCSDNTAGSWWAWSELPVRWKVNGSVKEVR